MILCLQTYLNEAVLYEELSKEYSSFYRVNCSKSRIFYFTNILLPFKKSLKVIWHLAMPTNFAVEFGQKILIKLNWRLSYQMSCAGSFALFAMLGYWIQPWEFINKMVLLPYVFYLNQMLPSLNHRKRKRSIGQRCFLHEVSWRSHFRSQGNTGKICDIANAKSGRECIRLNTSMWRC